MATRGVSMSTAQRLARRVAELSTALSNVRIAHTNGKDGKCEICHVADCATSKLAKDPRPVVYRWPSLPIPRKDG